MGCAECGFDPLLEGQDRCPECGTPNPNYRPSYPAPPAAAAAVPAAAAPPLLRATAGLTTVMREPLDGAAAAFVEVGKELDQARRRGWRIIANLGLPGAGKSFLIARMASLREASSNRAMRFQAGGGVERFRLEGHQYELPRTRMDETLLWHLPSTTGRPDWLVVDIAGEQVTRPFADLALQGDSLHNLILMTLAQADALKITLDGRILARELQGASEGTLDLAYMSIINELGRIVPWMRQFRLTHDITNTQDTLHGLRAAYADDRFCASHGGPRTVDLPVLLLITKADHFHRLTRESDAGRDVDALRVARRHLPLTYNQARKSLSVHRWQLCAPFLDQPAVSEDEDSEIMDLRLESYGVRSAVNWLETELASPGRPLRVSIEDAQRPVARWLPRFLRPGQQPGRPSGQHP